MLKPTSYTSKKEDSYIPKRVSSHLYHRTLPVHTVTGGDRWDTSILYSPSSQIHITLGVGTYIILCAI